ncbi:MAG: sugar phosphate isomerase/epimerase family protein [Sphingobacterium sp.]
MAHSRRNFLRLVSLGLAGGLVGPNLISCDYLNKPSGSPTKNAGLQLFTLRDLLAQSPKDVLESVAKIGYNHVETFDADATTGTFWGISVDELKKILNDNNLSTHSGHYDLGKYLDKDNTAQENIEKYIEIAHNLGQKYVIAPAPDLHKINSLDQSDYQYMAEQLNKAGEMAKKAGITMGYHNHFWEFKEFGNGTKGLDILLAFTEPDLVTFELDMFWITKAGERVPSYFSKYPGRFQIWHIKDMDRGHSEIIEQNKRNPRTGKRDTVNLGEIIKTARYAEVGSGSIDYTALAQYANESGLKYTFVEQDEIYAPNKYDSVKKSYDYIQKNFK